jgi:hypothetical protein
LPGRSDTISSSTPEKHARSPERHRTIKITMGSCTFIYKNGLQCSCTSGSLIIQADCISTGGTCDDCGHLLSLHRDYGRSIYVIDKGGSTNQLQSRYRGRPNSHRRFRTPIFPHVSTPSVSSPRC